MAFQPSVKRHSLCHRAGMTLKVSGAVFLAFLGLGSDLEAGESIRVAVHNGLSSVKINSRTALLIKDEKGRLLSPERASSVHIRPTAHGLKIDQKIMKISAVKVISPENDLEVEGQSYRGLIEVRKRESGLTVINELDIEDYLKGVVPVEMAQDWPLEALKAQAVVARTYALYQKWNNTGKEFDVVATVHDQVYKGAGQERTQPSLAVAETDGLIVTYQGQPALTLYHSTSAGRTQDIREVWGKDIPYLKGVECPFDEDSPYYQWRKKILLRQMEDSLRRGGLSVGYLSTFTPFLWDLSGRVKEVRILHSGGELFLKGEEVRKMIGYQALPSTRFDVVSIGQDMVLEGNGYGHGVGLCQWGTKVQAERGKLFREILDYYYPGVEVNDYRTLPLKPETVSP